MDVMAYRPSHLRRSNPLVSNSSTWKGRFLTTFWRSPVNEPRVVGNCFTLDTDLIVVGLAYLIDVDERTRYLTADDDGKARSACFNAFWWRRLRACLLARARSTEWTGVLAGGRLGTIDMEDDGREERVGETERDMVDAGRKEGELSHDIGELGIGELDCGGMGDENASISSDVECEESGNDASTEPSRDISERQSERDDVEERLDAAGETQCDPYDRETPSLSPTPWMSRWISPCPACSTKESKFTSMRKGRILSIEKGENSVPLRV